MHTLDGRIGGAAACGGGSIGGHGQVLSLGTYTRPRLMEVTRRCRYSNTHTFTKNQYKNIKVENKGSTQQPTVTVISLLHTTPLDHSF